MPINYPGSESDVETAALLGPHLREAMAVAESADRLLRFLVAHFETLDPDVNWPRVQAILTTRIADDVRAAASLVLRGYYPQAMTLGASVYETSYTAGFIGADKSRAEAWLIWSDMRHAGPWRLHEMEAEVRSVVFEVDGPGRDGRYTALCMGKHGNPYIQRAAGASATAEAHVLNADPALGSASHRLGEIALWLMIDPVVTYTGLLYRRSLMPNRAKELGDELVQLWNPFDSRMMPRA